MSFITQILLAFGGFLFHLGKQYQEAIKRDEVFVTKIFWASVVTNIIAIFILIYCGNTLPPELIVMSPLTCVIMGAFSGSMLSGFINTKKPKDSVSDDVKIMNPNKNS
jgi:small basic protein